MLVSTDVWAQVNYSNPDNWASIPSVKNNSMHVPSSLIRSKQGLSKADVFYIYPTVSDALFSKNASIDDEGYRNDVKNYLLTYQASSLNNIGKIYTPYYRQLSIWTYLLASEDSQKKAIKLAYNDIKSAFIYYLEHYNHGRPLFILSHSQGSQMAVQLLNELYQSRKLDEILVVAYVIGWDIHLDTFSDLKPCENAGQVNCFVTWVSAEKGTDRGMIIDTPAENSVCTNPLNWQLNGSLVPASQHLGGVPDGFDRVQVNIVSAECRAGILHIDPAPDNFEHENKDYHDSDINLFYMDLRLNSIERLNAFYKTTRSSGH